LNNFDDIKNRETFIHPDYLYSTINRSSAFKFDNPEIEPLQGLLWSIGIIIMKYIVNVNEIQIGELRSIYMIGIGDLIEKKEVNKILLMFLNNLFNYEKNRFSSIYVM
jgi:hypothetical protein